MKSIYSIFLLLVPFCLQAQSCYEGFLGKYPITLVTYLYSDGDSRAYYAYDKYDTPIIVNGRNDEGTLKLYERNDAGDTLATFVFNHFDEKSNTVKGQWISADASKSYPVKLQKAFDLEYGDNISWTSRELLQSASTENHYFKTIITKEEGAFYGRVSGVKVFEKKTDRLLQTIPLDCQLFGIDNVTIGDFNFDGVEDFSVFEASYAGPNTSCIYILRIPGTEKYEVSDFSGTSLEFDASEKRIYEHNQCCAGRSHMNATYKVENNHMVLIERSCLEYDEATDDFIETDCE